MTTTAMEQRRDDEPEPEPEFNLREWAVKARMVGRENRSSRRFSASNITSFSFRESFRSNITISSTASSPGYALTEEIDPSTYSFTAALEALQARSVSSADGLALNSKWNEAEKYICNPVSGEVPTQCLSAKTLLSGRSFRNLAAAKRITMSAPLVYTSTTTSHSKNLLHHTKPSLTSFENEVPFPIQENKVVGGMTRDVGTQSTPTELSSSSPSPASTPPIHERLIIRGEAQLEDSTVSNTAKLKFEEKVEVKETREKEGTKRKEEVEDDDDDDDERKIKAKKIYRCCSSSRRRRQGGCYCLSWRNLLMRKRQRYIRETQTKKQPQQQ